MPPIFTYGMTHVGRGRRESAKPTTNELVAKALSAEDLHKMDSNALRWHELNNRANLDIAIEAANQAEKQFERRDLRVTSSTDGGSKEAGARKGWDANKILSYADIQKMSANEAAWQQRFNATWKAAFENEEHRRENRQHILSEKIKLMWQGNATEEEDAAAIRAGEEFASKCPQFDRTHDTALKIVRYMQDNGLDGTDVRSYFTAFRALVETGTITIAKALTANEFLEQADVLKDHRIPPLVQARTAKADATREHFESAAKHTAHAGSTAYTEYPDEQSGYPPAPTKYSFRKLLDSLSSEAYQKRLNEDSAFRAACDKLNRSK